MAIIRWSLIALLFLAGFMFITHMPGSSYSGPLPPLTESEVTLGDNLHAHLAVIAGEIGERNVWHYAELEACSDHIRTSLTSLGYSVEEQPFESGGREVKNLSVEIPGRTLAEEIVVVGAHYDSVKGAIGANDNGSGVAGLLEIARLLQGTAPARTLRFVAFVNEEPPFFHTDEMGSRVYAERSKALGERVVAMLSLETIGYYSDERGSQRYPPPFSLFYPDRGNFIAFVGNLSSRALVRRAIGSFRNHTQFPSEGLAAPGWVTGVGWSDHQPFWKAGYPAIMVTDTAPFRYPDYHTAQDTADKIDYSKTARVVAGLSRMVLELAGGNQ